MENIKNFINKNKATIISVLSALLTFAISLSKIDMGTKVGVVMSILIVVIPVIISVLGGQDMEQSIKLLVNAITVIQQIVKDNKKEEKEIAEDEEAIARVGEGQEDLTEEEIRELITKGL
jgi:hypothetical protein